MSDLDIGLPFNDTPPRSRAARHRRRRQRGRDRRRSFAAFIVMIVVFGLLAGGAWYGYGKVRDFFVAPDFAGQGVGTAVITVEDGDTASNIANTLFRAGVVKSAKAFTDAASDDPRALEIQPGTYTLRQQMSGLSALQLMLDPDSKSVKRFLVKEGLTVKEILAEISKQTGIPLADFEAAAKDPAALGVPDWARPTPTAPLILEGFLFPAKYDVGPKDTAVSILTTMVAQANAVMAKDGFVDAAVGLNMSPLDLLKIASMIEQEGIPADFSKVSRVVYNRLKKEMRLDFDSTTQYWLIMTGKGRIAKLARKDIRNPANNYSTTLNKGLPPTPISNPGKAALDAASHPADGDWLYFVVTEKDGRSSFTSNINVHDRVNVPKCKAIGRC